VLIIGHNSKSFVPSLVEGLRRIAIPVTVYFLDNNSRDGTPEAMSAASVDLPFPVFILRSLTNNGFARGMNLLSSQGRGEFVFLLNPDAELETNCLERLAKRMEADDRIAICEARQTPREHPKAFDPQTGETTWCSGAAALIRRRAFDEVGVFDERLFFMYCEDVDLSWRLWLSGWKCIYVRDAVVRHLTQDLAAGRSRTLENYFDFRNSLFLFYRFGSWRDRPILWAFLQNRFLSRAYTARSKGLFAIALIDQFRYIPYLLHTRGIWNGRQHPWVRFDETSLAN
jgi:GT2 family glycosyltransferase